MGKVIDKIKNWFKRKPRLEERYTLNRKYLGRSEQLKRFIEERQYRCDMDGIEFTIIEADFPDYQYGTVELLRNGKVIDKAEFIKGKNDLIYWQFYNAAKKPRLYASISTSLSY